MTQQNIYVLEDFKSCLAHYWSEFFLKPYINFIGQILYQTEFEPISIHQFETAEAMRNLNIRHVISK
jgi:hypothetical protein